MTNTGIRQMSDSPAEIEPESPQHSHKLLIVAFHFPPLAGSSGILRTLKFSRYLPRHGWTPTVLSCKARAYERTDLTQLGQVPTETRVLRAIAFDSKRDFALRGYYPKLLSLPDRWVSWVFDGIRQGYGAIRAEKLEVIFSTYPIASAILIGYLLHRLSGKPWIVDLRDSMTEDNYPEDPLVRRSYRWIERKAMKHASKILFTTPSARKMYLARYTWLNPEKCLVISNGFDEEDFLGLPPTRMASNGPVQMIHAGLIYPSERDPRPFFRAIARLKREGSLTSDHLQVNLRASGNEDDYDRLLRELEIEDLVHLLPPIPYRQVLIEAAESDVSLLFQAANCNHQIPAKAYEYLRLGKPIFALTDAAGDTAELLRYAGGSTIVDIADENAIYNALPQFLKSIQSGSHELPNPVRVQEFSRESQARQLANVLDSIDTKK